MMPIEREVAAMEQESNVEKTPKLDTPQIASGVAVPEKMTYEEFLDWIDEGNWAEWVAGETIPMTAPNTKHQQICGFIFALAKFFVDANDLGDVFSAPYQMKLETQSAGRMPDMLFVARKNRKKLKKNYLDGPADLVVEIISPESRKRDRGDKFYEYEEAGVREYWIIDTDRKQAEFHGLGKDGVYRPLTVDKEGMFRSKTMTGFWFKVDWLWQEPLPSLLDVLKEWKLI
jgi:Uma2 family endonuclease